MIFPIGDDNIEGGHRPLFSYSLIAINVLLFLYSMSLGMDGYEQFVIKYGTIPLEIGSGIDLFTLITNMFLHGGWGHLLGNMLFLWIFADNIEAIVGNTNFIVFYLLGGIIATLAHVFLNIDSSIPAVGASGAISAVMGSYLVMFPKSRIKMIFILLFRRPFYIPAFLFLGFWFFQQLIPGMCAINPLEEQKSGVAWWAHIGGFTFGVIAGYIAKRSYFEKFETGSQYA